MRVLHFLKTAEGASWAVLQIRELIRLGVVVGVVVPPGSKIAEYKRIGAVVFEVDTSLSVTRPWLNYRRFSTIRSIVSEFKPDILHSHFFANTIALRLALGRKHSTKRIFQVPGPLHLEHYFFRKIDLFTSGFNDFWIGSCEWTQKCYLENGVPLSHVGLAYYGLDLDRRFEYKYGKLRDEFKISLDSYLVGNISYFYSPKWYLGQRVGIKGHEDLMAAMEIVAKSIPSPVLVFVGGPWGESDRYYEKVKRQAELANSFRVIFTGFRNDVHSLYKDFDVAVHPSHSENLGGAVESLLHGVPTIATEVGGFPDLVKHGFTGWLVTPKSPADLAKAIIDSASDRATSIEYARNGQRIVFEKLDVRKNAIDVYHYYESLIKFGEFVG